MMTMMNKVCCFEIVYYPSEHTNYCSQIETGLRIRRIGLRISLIEIWQIAES